MPIQILARNDADQPVARVHHAKVAEAKGNKNFMTASRRGLLADCDDGTVHERPEVDVQVPVQKLQSRLVRK